MPSNIAEGAGRATEADFAQFLHIAIGSLNEAETQITIAERIGFLSAAQAQPLIAQAQRTRRLLTRLVQTVRGTRSKRLEDR